MTINGEIQVRADGDIVFIPAVPEDYGYSRIQYGMPTFSEGGTEMRMDITFQPIIALDYVAVDFKVSP